MTTPGGGGLGEAYVTLTADSSEFEDDLARQLRKIAKERGPKFGEDLASGMLRGFRKQFRADIAKYEQIGASLGRSVRRGADGVKVGDRIAQDILRGMRARLKNADLRVGGVTSAAAEGVAASAPAGGGGGARGRSALGTDQERAEDRLRKILQKELAAYRRTQAEKTRVAERETRIRERLEEAATKAAEREAVKQQREAERAQVAETKTAERESRQREAARVREQNATIRAVQKGLRDAEKAEERADRDALRRRAARISALQRIGNALPGGSGGNGAISQSIRSVTALGPGGGFGAQGVTAVGGAALAAVPAIGSLFQSLRDMSGALFGLFPALTGAAALMAIFKGENVQTEKALKPVADALDKVRLNLDGIFAAASQGELSDFAAEVKRIQPGLEEFAFRLGNAFGNALDSLRSAGAGESLSRAFASVGQGIETLTAGPGLTKFFGLLLRINEQVSATLPGLFARLQGFLNGLGDRFANTDFGAIFERGIQAVIDFGASIINLLRVLNAFFAAVSGTRTQGTFFATLRATLAGLVLTIQANAPAITAFFDRVRAVTQVVIVFLGQAFRVIAQFGQSLGDAFRDAAPSMEEFIDFAREIGDRLVEFADIVGQAIGFVAGIAAQVLLWAQSTGVLLPFLAALGIIIAGIQLGLFIAGLATAIGAIVALGAPVLIAIGVLAAFAAAIIYANTSSSDLADIVRGTLNTAFQVLLFPMNLVVDKFGDMVRAIQLVLEGISRLPGVSNAAVNSFNAKIGAAVVVAEAAAARINSAFQIEGPSAFDQLSPADRRSEEGRDRALSNRDPNRPRRNPLPALPAPFKIPKFPNTPISLGPRSTGDGAGTAAAAAAVKEAVDLVALVERLTDSLQNALVRGAEETEEAFDTLGRTIRDALKGTLQEGRTGAAQAALQRARVSAIAAARSYEQISAAVEVTKERLSDLKDEQESFRESVRDTLRDAASISTFLSNRRSGSANSFGNFLQRQVKALERFSASLKTLLAKGLDPALVRDLAEGGLDNERFARRLAEADPGQVANINALQQQINALSQGTADTTAATFDAGIRRVEGILNLQLIQQKRQEAQLNALAVNIVKGIAAAIQGKPLPKFARGGITRGPSLAGEAGPELIIPLSANQRRRREQLLDDNGLTVNARGGRTVQASFVINPAPGMSERAIARAVDARLASLVR